MTLPDERLRALKNSREFLRSLLNPKETPGVPRVIRNLAGSCLRHYPSDFDMVKASTSFKDVFGEPVFKIDWDAEVLELEKEDEDA